MGKVAALSALVLVLQAKNASAERWDAKAPVRGVTVGPIESSLHPGKGYGSPACGRTMTELSRIGATWVSITPYGRVLDLSPTGIDRTFEAPFVDNRRAILSAIHQAHAAGLRVLLVPHLWVESGEWRGKIDPGSEKGWRAWARAYRSFLLSWAEVAREGGADMLSVGVELGSWVTSVHAASFFPIVADTKKIYSGLLTYSANWDDVDETVILPALDVIGINAFYPLADRDGAGFSELVAGGRRVADRIRRLAELWHKPVLFTELGYTTRVDPAVRPWEWPDQMRGVTVDQTAQADAYLGLLAPLLGEPAFLGFFAWRFYADPDDVSQEAEWGFSPRGKLAELVLRDAFRGHWEAEGGVGDRRGRGADGCEGAGVVLGRGGAFGVGVTVAVAFGVVVVVVIAFGVGRKRRRLTRGRTPPHDWSSHYRSVTGNGSSRPRRPGFFEPPRRQGRHEI